MPTRESTRIWESDWFDRLQLCPPTTVGVAKRVPSRAQGNACQHDPAHRFRKLIHRSLLPLLVFPYRLATQPTAFAENSRSFLGKEDYRRLRRVGNVGYGLWVKSLPVHLEEAAVAEFCQRHHVAKLSVFGSALRADFRPDSDVDVLVEFLPGHTPGLFHFAGMERELSELLHRQVDLRTPQDLSRYFRDEVLASAKVQYATG